MSPRRAGRLATARLTRPRAAPDDAYMHAKTALAVLSLWLAGCAASPFGPTPGEDVMLVPADGRIELGLDRHGRIVEVEYHCRIDDVPPAARRAVEAVLPGGEVVGCEKEYHGSTLYYEIAKRVDGREVEIMVTPDGRVHARELEVPATGVPDAVLEAAAKAVPGGTRTKVEEARDGANNLLEYHVKATLAGVAYKAVLTPAGKLLRLLRETTAEVEVPVAR